MRKIILLLASIVGISFNSYAYQYIDVNGVTHDTEYEFVLSEADADYIEIVEEETPYQQVAKNISAEEDEVLKIILACEAQTEGLTGEMAVVEVIFNRVLSDKWPNSIYGVLSQKGQFATWKYRNHPYNVPTELESDAIAEVADSSTNILPAMDYVYFATYPCSWMHDVVKIGNHYFGR